MTKEGREESKSGSDTELMYKEILASAGIGSWIMDLNTGIVTGCGEFRSILGLREHTTDRALIIQRVLPEFRDELIKAAMHGLKGLPMVVELPLDTQNGLPYTWTRVLGKVKFSQSGKRMAMVGMIENITEWKDKDQNKDDIISYLNHELRTPLTSLRLYIQRAARSAKQEGLDGINKLLGKADQQITSMQRLTESYLEFTSGEDGSITLDISSFDLYSYLESVILEYQFQYPEYRFKLSCPKNLCLLADLEKLLPVDETRLDKLASDVLSKRNYVYAAEGFLQLLENDEQRLIDQDREYLIDDGFEVGELLIRCAQNGEKWENLKREEQSLIISFANIFEADCRKRAEQFTLIEVAA